MKRNLNVTAILFVWATASAFAQELTPSAPFLLYPSKIVSIDGNSTIYCELMVPNNLKDTIAISKIKVMDKRKNRSFDAKEIAGRLGLLNASNARANRIPPGNTGVIYLELELNTSASELHSVIEFATLDPNKSSFTANVTITTSQSPLMIIGAPLKSGPWAAIYDPSWERGHRRVIYSPTGAPHIPGRYAIDFLKSDENGKLSGDNEDLIANWFGYSEDVLAVADGTIASVCDDFIESSSRSGQTTAAADRATGNYVSIDLGGGNIAFYEHLKPNSIKVKPGQRVKKGDVIASLGFTGQAREPHLHFSIANVDSPLDAEGIAFAFENFTVRGRYSTLDNFGQRPFDKGQRETLKNARPGPNTVVVFK